MKFDTHEGSVPMSSPRKLSIVAGLAALLVGSPAFAQDKIKVIASFSILGDLVKNVGGDRVDVSTLVGPNGDAHVFSPSPADARRVATSRVIFVNGLGFEGWMTRLVKASGTKAPLVVVSKGIKVREMEEEGRRHESQKERVHDKKNGHGHDEQDPHAWQSVVNAKIYVANIRDGLTKADPAGKETYSTNADAYLAKLDALEKEIKREIAKIPADRRRIITSHDAFGYFGAAYGIKFISPEGMSTESQASAKDVAKIIVQIKKQMIPAVFMENISSARLIEQIARETGAKIGGTLYSDALSEPGGPAGTYIDMMRHNVRELSIALTS